jgi:hypothetical protein
MSVLDLCDMRNLAVTICNVVATPDCFRPYNIKPLIIDININNYCKAAEPNNIIVFY